MINIIVITGSQSDPLSHVTKRLEKIDEDN